MRRAVRGSRRERMFGRRGWTGRWRRCRRGRGTWDRRRNGRGWDMAGFHQQNERIWRRSRREDRRYGRRAKLAIGTWAYAPPVRKNVHCAGRGSVRPFAVQSFGLEEKSRVRDSGKELVVVITVTGRHMEVTPAL